jgi:hypothetical protein
MIVFRAMRDHSELNEPLIRHTVDDSHTITGFDNEVLTAAAFASHFAAIDHVRDISA